MFELRDSDSLALRRQLKGLLAQARNNEKKMRRLQSLELRLIAATSLFELIKLLIYDYRRDFDLDCVSVVLIDPEYEVQRILEHEDVVLDDHPGLIFSPLGDDLDGESSLPLFPVLGPYRRTDHAALYPKECSGLASVAILPLVRHGKFVGSLNLGSKDVGRYGSGAGTDLLERLAGIVAICIENALNYERLKRAGLTDPLTTINNRRFFDQRLGEEVERARRNAQPISCLFIDIDHFKRINDTYGHPVGDQVLKRIARLINAQMRRSDVLARYGGEEFAVLLGNSRGSEAVETAERVRSRVAEEPIILADGHRIDVTVSIGVATAFPGEQRNLSASEGQVLLEQADMALLEAKAAGRNRVHVTAH